MNNNIDNRKVAQHMQQNYVGGGNNFMFDPTELNATLQFMSSVNFNDNGRGGTSSRLVCGIPIDKLNQTIEFLATVSFDNSSTEAYIDLSTVHAMPLNLDGFDRDILNAVKATIDLRYYEEVNKHISFRNQCGKRKPCPSIFLEAIEDGCKDKAMLALIQWRYKSHTQQKSIYEQYMENTDKEERKQHQEQLRTLMGIPELDTTELVRRPGGRLITKERDLEIEQNDRESEQRIKGAELLIEAANNDGRLHNLRQMYHPAYVDENNKPPVRSVADFSPEIQQAVDNVKTTAQSLENHSTKENYDGLVSALECLENISPGWTFDYNYQTAVPPPLPDTGIATLGNLRQNSGHISKAKGSRLVLQDCLSALIALRLNLHESHTMVSLHKQWFDDKGVPLPDDNETELVLSSGVLIRFVKSKAKKFAESNPPCKNEVSARFISACESTTTKDDKLYQRISLHGKSNLKVSIAFCYAFHGPPPLGNGWDVDHINRDTSDDRPENLRWAKNQPGGLQAKNNSNNELLEINKHFRT